ncbi:MAG: NFACT RNA binding domain-containing protein [Myxococcota bacterium]|nr:NFACT RNA binding domain-containing protein [Myxococcota bacterium]
MLSLAELARAVRVLDAAISGHRLQDASQPAPERVVLTLYGRDAPGSEGRRRHVQLACGAETARLSQLAKPPRALPRPPAFTQYLRAHAVGARVTGVSLRGSDRLAALGLETKQGAATLLFQILGRRSNLYYLDAEERVVLSLRPLESTRPELSLGEAWRDPASRPPREGEDRFADVDDAGLLAAIEAHYAEREAEDEQESLTRQVEQALRKQEKRLARKLEKLERELEAAEAATGLARQGELLKSALSGVKRGDERVVVRDWETGEDVEIALDRTMSPGENLDALFKRYQKALRRLTKGGAQDDAVRHAHRETTALLAEFATLAESPEAVREFAERPPVKALLDRRAPAASAGAPRRTQEPREIELAGRRVPRRLAPRRYRTESGLEVWVGRSDDANDFLTTRLARGKDLFFHLDGAPGSHVILRTEGRSDPPAEAVLDACELAVHYSKAKKASRADVHVVPIKNVKKPKGAKPGLVMVHGGRSVHLRREPARLERILASRVD